MIENYLPILKAKKGEFDALGFASQIQSAKMLPLFEISKIGKQITNAKRFSGSTDITSDYLNEIAERIANRRKGLPAMVDSYQWQPDAHTSSGEHIMTYMHNRLRQLGVISLPVIGYDRWESSQYQMAMQNLQLDQGSYYCLRLDSHAIDDSEEPDFFKEQIFGIIDTLQADPTDCGVIIDFGDITNSSIERLLDEANRVIENLAMFGFKFYSVVGCSMPTTIDIAVKKHDSTGLLVRKEMILWQALRQQHPNVRFIFGDYGVRGPNTAEDIIAPHTNGKIRYTTQKQYFISRGHSQQHGNGSAQMYSLARSIIQSSYYLGESFSWGDARIMSCANEEFIGSASNWIAIDTNHHLAYVIAEVEEFELVNAAKAKATATLQSPYELSNHQGGNNEL